MLLAGYAIGIVVGIWAGWILFSPTADRMIRAAIRSVRDGR